MKRCVRLVLSASAAMAIAGCSSGGSGSGAGITIPTPVIAENFAGTIDVAGSDFHTFNVTATGTLNVTLTAAGPPASIFMGVGIGSPTAATATVAPSCTLLANASVAAPAGTTPQLSGTIAPGSYCVSVFDVGNQTAQITYAVTVSHP